MIARALLLAKVNIRVPYCLVRRRMGGFMNGTAIAILVSLFAAGSAMANDTCPTKGVDKNGKPLTGAALTSFVKHCKEDACEPQARGEDGKPLRGAAKAKFMKECMENE
jgi:hypothetical protein